MVAGLVGTSLTKGLLSGAIGLVITVVGLPIYLLLRRKMAADQA